MFDIVHDISRKYVRPMVTPGTPSRPNADDTTPQAENRLEAVNPRTGEIDHFVQMPTPEAVAAMIDEMRVAQRAWLALGLEGRLEALLAWADAVEASAQEIGDAESIDTGRYRVAHEVPHMVVSAIRDWCRRAPEILANAQPDGTSSVMPDVSFTTQVDPYPVVGVISPWNHPFLLSTTDAVPALIAGCAVIVKPSEITPRFIEPVMASIDSVPTLASVFRYVPGDGAVGAALIAQVDALSFTGSVPTGRAIAEACARRFIPAFLELGGKDAAIVTASADIPAAAAAVLKGAVHNTGQICFSTERVYVDQTIAEPFVAELVALAEQLELSYPDPRRGHLGPFIMQRQAEVVDDHLREALETGAQLRTGGPSEEHGGGVYMRPTVVTDVDHSMRLMREETFGPVIPVMTYADVDSAIELANDTEFGLSAAVLAGSVDEATRIAERLNAGAISLQDSSLTIGIMRDVEKMSYGRSGLGGSRMGPAGLLRFLRKKALIARNGPVQTMEQLAEHTATPAS